MIESLSRQNNSAGRPTVRGLATGSTPVGLYRELIRLHKEAGLDFSRVITFNVDEYFPMQPDDPHSYRRWMQETFCKHVNINPSNIHIPDGTIPSEAAETYSIPAERQCHRADGAFVVEGGAVGEGVDGSRAWALGSVPWPPQLLKRAVIWLSLKVGKGLLKLSDDDFREHELYELLREHGPAEKLGRKVFDQMMATICTQPAGAEPRTALVFSPHPDDDVISMGGTLIRLVEHGHRTHVAYMTSGNIAVFDHDAWRFTDFAVAFNRLFEIDQEKTERLKKRVREFLS